MNPTVIGMTSVNDPGNSEAGSSVFNPQKRTQTCLVVCDLKLRIEVNCARLPTHRCCEIIDWVLLKLLSMQSFVTQHRKFIQIVRIYPSSGVPSAPQ
jgi:hypothetical protein